MTLRQVPTGSRAVVKGFGQLLPDQQRCLQAYGLTPGREVCVLQRHPVLVVLIENTELAFELEIAQQVFVSLS
jgi:Fe2+ transport system protein FeoA